MNVDTSSTKLNEGDQEIMVWHGLRLQELLKCHQMQLEHHMAHEKRNETWIARGGLGRDTWGTYNHTWSDYVGEGLDPVTFGMISRALSGLKVGRQGSSLEHERPRFVNGDLFPKGLNIPVSFVQDLGPYDIKKYEDLPGVDVKGGVCETTYNSIDGVIVINKIEKPNRYMKTYEGVVESPENLFELEGSDVIGAYLKRMKVKRRADEKAEAEKVVERAEKVGQLVDPIPPGSIGSWLSMKVPEGVPINAGKLDATKMGDWLNYVVVIGKPTKETLQAVHYVLRERGVQKTSDCLWGSQQVFRADIPDQLKDFQLLLGTDSAEEAVWMLLKRKFPGGLGRKIVKSITLFYPEKSEGLSREAMDTYLHPAWIFELDNVD